MVTASDRSAVAFSLSGGNAHDSPEGERLVDSIERLPEQIYMLMDRAYEGDKMRAKVTEKGFVAVVLSSRMRMRYRNFARWVGEVGIQISISCYSSFMAYQHLQ